MYLHKFRYVCGYGATFDRDSSRKKCYTVQPAFFGGGHATFRG